MKKEENVKKKNKFLHTFFCVSRKGIVKLFSLSLTFFPSLSDLTYSIGGSSLRKIEARQQVKNRKEGEDRDSLRGSKVSQSCQAGSCMDYCESCTLAGEAILDAINSIEQVFVENKLISVSTTER